MQVPVPQRLVGGLYWRRSKINGRKVEPVILRLWDGVLYLSGRQGPVFAVPVNQVVAKFSSLGTMTLQVPDGKFDIVGRGGAIAVSFTPQQLAELQAAGAAQPAMGAANNPWNVGALGNTAPWRDALGYNGARIA